MSSNYLWFNQIQKRFGGTTALAGINFSVAKGEIHAIVGENGAGKSTLLTILAGEQTQYEGELVLDGKPLRFTHPKDALENGISLVHQELNLCNNLNVQKNIFLGMEKKYSKEEMRTKLDEVLRNFELNIDVTQPVDMLSSAVKQMIEIAKASITTSKILILDEPTSSLNSIEVQQLFGILKEINKQGVTILFVSHRLEEVMEIADRISVLRDGHYIKTMEKDKTNKQEIISLMVGRELFHTRSGSSKLQNDVLLSVDNLSCDKIFKNISFQLHKGEVLGFAGLEGSRRYEVVRALFGMMEGVKGEVRLFDEEYKIKSPYESIKKGIVFLGKERKEEGIFRLMSLALNIGMASTLSNKIYRKREIEELALEQANRLRIKYFSIAQLITTLSGGNQQKAIIARSLTLNPKVMIMEDPGRGIDVGSKAEIYEIIRKMADKGTSFLIVSSELDELMSICDRIIVMQRGGEIAGVVDAATTTQEEIMTLATGLTV